MVSSEERKGDVEGAFVVKKNKRSTKESIRCLALVVSSLVVSLEAYLPPADRAELLESLRLEMERL